jgi:hypothetical protein
MTRCPGQFSTGLTDSMVCSRRPLCELCENPHLPQVFIAGKEISDKVRKVHKGDRLATFHHFTVGSFVYRAN